MASPLDSLASLSLNASDPNGLIAARLKKEDALREMQRSLELQAGDPRHTFSGATNADIAGEQSDLAESPNFGTEEQGRIKGIQDTNDALTAYNRPDVTKKRTEDLAAKLAEASAPANAQAAGALAVEKEKGTQAAAADERLRAGNAATLQMLGAGGSGQGGEANPVTMRPSFNAKGQLTLSGVPTPPTVLAQQHGAGVGLAEIPKLRAIIDTLDKAGMVGPVAGRLGSAAVGTGLDSLLMSPDASRAFNDFKNQAAFVKGNMAMVHGGARGGSNQAMAERFDKLINTAQTPAAMKGALDAFERWLTQYAGAKSSAELDAADAQLGIPSVGASQTKPLDLGADWGK